MSFIGIVRCFIHLGSILIYKLLQWIFMFKQSRVRSFCLLGFVTSTRGVTASAATRQPVACNHWHTTSFPAKHSHSLFRPRKVLSMLRRTRS